MVYYRRSLRHYRHIGYTKRVQGRVTRHMRVYIPPLNVSFAALSARAVPCVGVWVATPLECLSNVDPAVIPLSRESTAPPSLWRQVCAEALCPSSPHSPSPPSVFASSAARVRVSLVIAPSDRVILFRMNIFAIYQSRVASSVPRYSTAPPSYRRAFTAPSTGGRAV